jgi:hypothetical protein
VQLRECHFADVLPSSSGRRSLEVFFCIYTIVLGMESVIGVACTIV